MVNYFIFNMSKSSSSSYVGNIRYFVFFNSSILALRATIKAKLVILSISFLIPFILPLRVVLAAKLVTSGILFSYLF